MSGLVLAKWIVTFSRSGVHVLPLSQSIIVDFCSCLKTCLRAIVCVFVCCSFWPDLECVSCALLSHVV